MSNFGGRHSLFEKDFADRFKYLNDTLNKLEDNILSILSSSMDNPEITNAYWNAVRREIDIQYSKMVSVFDQWAKKEIPLRYRRSIRNMAKRINTTKTVINVAKLNTIELLHTRGSAQVMGLLYKNAIDDFLSATVTGRRNVRRFTRLTQQKLISDSAINLELSAIFIEEGNLGKAISGLNARLWNEAKEAMDGKRFVQAGKYKYKPSYYAQMVGRVRFHEAQSEAGLMTAVNYGTDLMQVSSHNTTTTICLDFEGKVFSISGNDSRFPILTDTSPFHPNCLHLMYPTFEGAMKTQGTLDSFSAFSKGDISRPPVPAGFIPIAKRKIA